MKLTVRSILTDVSYQVNFKEALLDLSDSKGRRGLTRAFLKGFELRLNDLKFNNRRPSDNLIEFSRYYDVAWLRVSFGLEEFMARIRNPLHDAQILAIYTKLMESIGTVPIQRQRIIVQHHFSTEGDANLFLKSLNPTIPSKFEDLLDGRGVNYHLKISSHNLTTYITLINSLYVPDGLFLSIENNFSPNKYDYIKTLELAKEQYEFIMNELNISLEQET